MNEYFKIGHLERDVQNFVEWIFSNYKFFNNGKEDFFQNFLSIFIEKKENDLHNLCIHREKEIGGVIPDFVIEIEKNNESIVLCIEIKQGKNASYNNNWDDYESNVKNSYQGNEYFFRVVNFSTTERKKCGKFKMLNYEDFEKVFLEWSKTNVLIEDFYNSIKLLVDSNKKATMMSALKKRFEIGKECNGFIVETIKNDRVCFSRQNYKMEIIFKSYECKDYKLKVTGRRINHKFESMYFSNYNKGKQILRTKKHDIVKDINEMMNLIPVIVKDLTNILFKN